MPKDTQVNNLIVNRLTRAQYKALEDAGTVSNTELYIITDDNPDAAVWGSISGTLTNQTDLKNALNGKQANLSTAQLNAANSGITSTKVSTYDGYATTISGKADKATTLSGYGITDAKIDEGTVTLGTNTITPLTAESSLDATKLSGTASINTTGNAATATSATKASQDGRGNTISTTYATKTELGDKANTADLATVATSGSYNDLSNKPTIPTKVSELTNDSGFTTNTGTVTGIKMNGASKGTSGVVDLGTVITSTADCVKFINNTVTVAGTSKTVSKTSPEVLYVPNGLIMGGTAQAAGLTTRGICGIGTPTETGACAKDNLYINYDGNNTNNPNGRGIVLNAGEVGADLGNGMRAYTVPRGDVVKAWVEAKGYITGSGSITGNAATATKATQDASGNVITTTYATKTELGDKANTADLATVATSGSYNDLTNKPSIPSEVTESTVSGWGFTKNTGTYSKPSGGIPKTDLASAVQTSLGKADTALQGITSSQVTTALGYTPYNSTNPNGYTSNVGTITGIKMNGASKGTSGVVDLGTVITSHQDISGKANKATTLAGYGITDAYTKTEVDNKVASVYKYKGSVASVSALPTTGQVTGDVYNVEDTGMNYAWDGTAWDALSTIVDLSPYAKSADLKTVATTGSYNDLTNKPTIPAAVTETTVSGWGFTKNTGTVTGIKMNGASKGTSGVVDLGTVITSHQDISGKVNKAGDTMTGALNFANNTWNLVGDDAYMGDCNVGGCVGIKGKNAATGINFVPYSGSTAQTLKTDGAGMMTASGNFTSAGSVGVGNNACKMNYNTTTESMEFIFA